VRARLHAWPGAAAGAGAHGRGVAAVAAAGVGGCWRACMTWGGGCGGCGSRQSDGWDRGGVEPAIGRLR
jgi:hypothetical protein